MCVEREMSDEQLGRRSFGLGTAAMVAARIAGLRDAAIHSVTLDSDEAMDEESRNHTVLKPIDWQKPTYKFTKF